jgi:hypothetical protein
MPKPIKATMPPKTASRMKWFPVMTTAQNMATGQATPKATATGLRPTQATTAPRREAPRRWQAAWGTLRQFPAETPVVHGTVAGAKDSAIRLSSGRGSGAITNHSRRASSNQRKEDGSASEGSMPGGFCHSR